MNAAATALTDAGITATDLVLSLHGAPKFTTEVVTGQGRLVNAAWAYLQAYEGTFPFLLDIKHTVRTKQGLTLGRAAGILNCLKADLTYTAAQQTAVPVPTVKLASEGTYTLGNAEGRITIRIKATLGKPGIAQVAEFLAGPDNTLDFIGFAFITDGGQVRVWKSYKQDSRIVAGIAYLMAATDEDRKRAGFEYALASSRCCKCGRTLTVPASIHQGLGPVCAEGGLD